MKRFTKLFLLLLFILTIDISYIGFVSSLIYITKNIDSSFVISTFFGSLTLLIPVVLINFHLYIGVREELILLKIIKK